MLFKRIGIALAALAVSAGVALAQGSQFPAGTMWGNDTAAQRGGKVSTVTAILDRALGSTRGSIIARGASGWAIVTPGATGLAYISNGVGADPSYQVLGIAGGGTGAITALAARAALGVAIGSQVEAWDADLDCLAAISTTGVIKRTGAGTCSAGTIALSDIVTGSVDTALGYWGSTTASAIAVPNCSTALIYNTGTHTFGCNGGTGSGTVTSVQISAGIGIAVATTSGANPCVATCNLTVSLTAARQTLPTVQSFTSGTNATYTTPANVLWIEVWVVGGGAGGGGGNNGTSSTVGNPSCWNTSGTACTTPVYQGGGGGIANNTTAGAGGSTSGSGTCNLLAASGGPGNVGSAGTSTLGGVGASGGSSAALGGGGTGGAGAVAGNAGAANTGGGGGGGGVAAATLAYGGGGGGGGAVCGAIINSPAATYVYTVGATAAGASAGSSGGAGAAGAAGKIWVVEHYGS